MDKIKCIRSENGIIIPIRNISLISDQNSSHYVWTNADTNCDSYGHKLSNKSYNILLDELDIIDSKGFID